MPFLNDCYYCLDCGWIGESSAQCEKYTSRALSLLSVWIDRVTPLIVTQTQIDEYRRKMN